MKQPVILSAVRTAVGRFGGTLGAVIDRSLAGLIVNEAVMRAGVAPEQVEELIFSHQYRNGELPPQHSPAGEHRDAGLPIPSRPVPPTCWWPAAWRA